MIRIFQGNTIGPYIITVRDKVTKLPVNLTGVTIFYTVKGSKDILTTDEGAYLTGSITSHSDQVLYKGKTTLPLITEDLTENIPVGQHDFDFKFVKAGEYVLNTFSIPFSVLKPNTRRKVA